MGLYFLLKMFTAVGARGALPATCSNSFLAACQFLELCWSNDVQFELLGLFLF